MAYAVEALRKEPQIPTSSDRVGLRVEICADSGPCYMMQGFDKKPVIYGLL